MRDKVIDVDFMRFVIRYDFGVEWEVEFFGGRLKFFVDWDGGDDKSEKGVSFVIKRGGGKNGRRMVVGVVGYKVESYLGGGKFFFVF